MAEMNRGVRNIQDSPLYQADVQHTALSDLPWDLLNSATVMVSGATGLLGTFLTDVLMYRNTYCHMCCRIVVVGRNAERARLRFSNYWGESTFEFVRQDINDRVVIPGKTQVDYVIHLASNTHPVAYATNPVQTVMDNVIGTNNLLQFATHNDVKRFVFASSCEVYGENRGDTKRFSEEYCGYIDPNTLRAGYPESKRCGEALCQAYREQTGIEVVIPRFSRCYGPTVLLNDSKASTQFLRNALSGDNIVLKSQGTQYYSYSYVSDAISGLLYILLKGEDGQAYNIADSRSDIHLSELANTIASICGVSVVVKTPNETESIGFSKVTMALQDGTKLWNLGWRPEYSIQTGIARTIAILKF